MSRDPRRESPLSLILPGNSPLELKAAPGLLAKILERVEDCLLREAERWSDPWQFLLGVKGLPVGCYDLFRAGASVSCALVRMTQMSYGGATLNRSLLDEIRKAQEREFHIQAERLARQLLIRQWQFGLWPKGLRSGLSQDEQVLIEKALAVEEKKLMKRHGRAGLETRSLPGSLEFQESRKVESIMIEGWLRWGELGEIGLCFFSDEAMADLIELLLTSGRSRGQRRAHYEKIRQRLGLEHAYPPKPKVVSARRVGHHIKIEVANAGQILDYPLVSALPDRDGLIYPFPAVR
jgi:hypothetical protein